MDRWRLGNWPHGLSGAEYRCAGSREKRIAPTAGRLQFDLYLDRGHAELARVDVGTAIGELPQGVSRTSIQEDFDREIQRLKLEKYRTAVKQDLGLDLRENRQAKTQAAAFIDLERSSFLHRLRILGVKFAEQVQVRQDSATWAERWTVQWTPESEITLVESVLLGETIELACGYRFKQLIDDAASIDIAAHLVGDACQSNLLTAMDFAQQKLQHLASESFMNFIIVKILQLQIVSLNQL